ncbi:MAG TPA: hypothetical protein VKZ53_30270 [Candidatus Angelobacter sp.]|nr:hypothetical protein [Candidatus Angelobacter sp.]
MDSDKQILLEVLRDAKVLISRPGNDFAWSEWDDASAALATIQDAEEQITNNDFSRLSHLETIFAPTGSMQELSIASGWSDDYLILASRFDKAIHRLRD